VVKVSFPYANSWDEQNQRCRRLQVGRQIEVNIECDSLLIKAEVGAPQLAQEQEPDERVRPPGNGHREPGAEAKIETPADSTESRAVPPRARRYHGSVSLDPLRLGLHDVAIVADEIGPHLMKRPGAKVELWRPRPRFLVSAHAMHKHSEHHPIYRLAGSIWRCRQ